MTALTDAEHFPLRGGTACECGWDYGLSLNDTRSDMRLWIGHYDTTRTAALEAERTIDPKISAAHFPNDGQCPASGVPVECCDTCNVLTAYAGREQRWMWNIYREQNALARATKAEADLAALRARIETLADELDPEHDGHDFTHGHPDCTGCIHADLRAALSATPKAEPDAGDIDPNVFDLADARERMASRPADPDNPAITFGMDDDRITFRDQEALDEYVRRS